VDTSVGAISLAWAAFWIALAAVIVSGRWLKARREALKYDTLVRLAEKTGRIDEEQLKILFPPQHQHPLPPHWFAPRPAGEGRMVLRVFGTIAMAVAVGLAICFLVVGEFGNTVATQSAAVNGFGAAIVLAFLGVGLFIAGRFAPPRRDDREAP
jgi:hypothetical protein